MKVSVTGGSGFIGQAFLERMRSHAATGPFTAPIELKVLTSSEQGRETLRTKYPDLELRMLNSPRGELDPRALEGTDTLLHLGWSTVPGTAKADPVADLRSNVEGGIALLQAAILSGTKRVIFVSSGGTVYGEPIYLPIDERHPVAPCTPYGASKLMFEYYLGCMADLHGFEQVVLRPGNIYGRIAGPNKPQGVVEHWLASIAAQRTVQVWNGLDVVRDYIHIDDVVEVLARLLHYEGGQHLFNLGTGIGTSLRELAALLERTTGRSITIDQTGRTEPDVRTNILDPGLVLRELGFAPKIGLEEGVTRTWSGMMRDTGTAAVR